MSKLYWYHRRKKGRCLKAQTRVGYVFRLSRDRTRAKVFDIGAECYRWVRVSRLREAQWVA